MKKLVETKMVQKSVEPAMEEITILKWETEDGQIFDRYDDAKYHEYKLNEENNFKKITKQGS